MQVKLVLLTLRPPMSPLTHGHHNAMWVRIVNGFVMPIVILIKRCFDTNRDATQNTDSSDPKYVVTQVTIENDWLIFTESFTYTEVSTVSGMWSDGLCIYLERGPIILRPDVFICDSLSPDQNRQS